MKARAEGKDARRRSVWGRRPAVTIRGSAKETEPIVQIINDQLQPIRDPSKGCGRLRVILSPNPCSSGRTVDRIGGLYNYTISEARIWQVCFGAKVVL
jgi:hypothetical protein